MVLAMYLLSRGASYESPVSGCWLLISSSMTALRAGHDAVQKVTLIPRGQARGLTWFIPGEDPTLISKQQIFARIVGALGGRATEQVVFGDAEVTTGASSDLQQVCMLVPSPIVFCVVCMQRLLESACVFCFATTNACQGLLLRCITHAVVCAQLSRLASHGIKCALSMLGLEL